MNENYITHPDEMGAIHISDEVLAAIAASAALEIEGVAAMMNSSGKKAAGRGVKITMVSERTVVDLFLMVTYGQSIPEVAAKVQSAVATAMESMAGFAVNEINVHVGGVCFAK